MSNISIKETIDKNTNNIKKIEKEVNDFKNLKESERNLQLITENKRLKDSNKIVNEELKKERKKYNHSTKLIIKQSIPIVWFLGFELGLIWYLYSTGVIKFASKQGTDIIWYILFFTLPMVFGINRASVIKFGVTLLKIMARRDLTTDDRIVLLREAIDRWVGVYADLSHVQALEEKQTKKIHDIINS